MSGQLEASKNNCQQPAIDHDAGQKSRTPEGLQQHKRAKEHEFLPPAQGIAFMEDAECENNWAVMYCCEKLDGDDKTCRRTIGRG